MRLLILITAAAVAAGACNRGADAAAANGSSAATAGAGSEAAAPKHEAAPAEEHDVTIPAGTVLPIVLDTAVGSATSRVEEPVHGHLTKPIVVRGVTAVPTGSRVSGVVTDATRSGRVKGRAHLSLRFETLVPSGADQRYAIQTSAVGRTAESTRKKDALEIGAPAAGGALIGALVGGKKGALVGGAVGAGGGTAVVVSTRGKEVSLPRGAALSLRLTEPVTVRIRG
ncbi:MAG TPA: hypothetical protein VFB07_00435 [Vicinamibacterales bacterium]|nr:hypothetical protein [Vicinamibacterales bacterium]